MKKTVVYAATRNIYPNVVPCVRSLAANGNVDEAVILIEDDEFPYELPEICRTINVAGQSYFRKDGKNARKRWTCMVLMKVALSQIFPELNRVLYLDCDTIVEHDLGDLWEMDLTGYFYAAVRQPNDGRGGRFLEYIDKAGADYFNAGVLLCNLSMLRELRMDHLLIKALNMIDYEFCEQDCITDLCHGKILALPGRYNVSRFTVPDEEGEIYIRHFAADAGWMTNEWGRRWSMEED